MAIRNRKQRRAAYARASSQKQLKANHPINRIAKMVQRLKTKIRLIEGDSNGHSSDTESTPKSE